MESFGKLITVFLSLLFAVIINAFVFIKLWAWFIIPVFQTSPLNMAEAVGLSFFIGYIKYKNDPKKLKKSKHDDNVMSFFWKSIAATFFAALFFLLFGWIISLFM